MSFKTLSVFARVLGWALGSAAWTAQAQHAHINAGAESPVAGAQLIFVNQASFETESGYLIHLLPLDSIAYGPIYFGGKDVTFTSLPSTLDNGGPHPKAALVGTRIQAVVESVSGPVGGMFSFWDSFDGFFDATEITFSVAVGAKPDGIHSFYLSENEGSPDSDPYGHIHGRKFSVNVPGLYTVGIRLVDMARNGPNQGPQHASSDVVYFHFQAGTTLGPVQVQDGLVTLQFGTELEKNYYVETTDSLQPENSWKMLLGPISGTGRLETVRDVAVGSSQGFFRLRVE